jgi:DNA-binding CsgD family transcriptional regulator/tetratricopeptide (TPR) repeat protein
LDWAERLRADYDNIRAALEWGARHPESDLLTRLTAALFIYWRLRGEMLTEGRTWTRRALEHRASHETRAGAQVLHDTGIVDWLLGNYTRALSEVRESAALFAALDHPSGLARSLGTQGMILSSQGRHSEGHRLCIDAVALARSIGDRWMLATTLHQLGWVELNRNELKVSPGAQRESRDLFRAVGDHWGEMVAVRFLALAVELEGGHDQAAALTEEQVALARALGNASEVARGLQHLGHLAESRHEWGRALEHYRDSLATSHELGTDAEASLARIGILAELQGDMAGAEEALRRALDALSRQEDQAAIALCLLGFAGLAEARGQVSRAGRLMAVAERLLAEPGLFLEPAARAVSDRVEATLRANLDDSRLAELRRETDSLTLDAAIAAALEGPDDDDEPPRTARSLTARQSAKQAASGLTERERDVVTLIVEGRSNREIAEALVVGVKTVEAHVTRILTKLGFSSRAQIAAWAVERGLAPPPRPQR